VTEAAEVMRGLIDRIVLTPVAAELRTELHGDSPCSHAAPRRGNGDLLEIRREYRWLRGLATTLTCSSMHLDWNCPYGGVGSQPPMPNATLRETPTATILPLRRRSCSDVNFRSCIAQWSMVLPHRDYHLRRCVTQTQPKTNAPRRIR
jgi:hypothetical protein